MTAVVEAVRLCARAECGAALVRRGDERSNNWRLRRYCSPGCSTRDRGAAGRSKPRKGPADGARTCARHGCGEPLVRRAGENTDDWLARRYCSKQCYERRMSPFSRPQRERLQLGARRCAAPGCGLDLVRRDGECATDWRRRKFCNIDCRNAGYKRPAPAPELALVDEDADWQADALCRGRPEPFWVDSTDASETERCEALARRFCAGCPVFAACKAKGSRVQYGLYGGVLWRRSSRGGIEPIDLLHPGEIGVAS